MLRTLQHVTDITKCRIAIGGRMGMWITFHIGHGTRIRRTYIIHGYVDNISYWSWYTGTKNLYNTWVCG